MQKSIYRRQNVAELRSTVGPALPTDDDEDALGASAMKTVAALRTKARAAEEQQAAISGKAAKVAKAGSTQPGVQTQGLHMPVVDLRLEHFVPERVKRCYRALRKSAPRPTQVRLVANICFISIFTWWLANSRDSDFSFAYRKLVRKKFIDTEFHVEDTEVLQTFNDVVSTRAVYQFLQGPFLDGLFGEQVSRATGSFDVGWVNTQSRLVGAPRLRQIRVATNSCRIDLLAYLVPPCYPALADGARRRAPLYGANLGGGLRRVYRYNDAFAFPVVGLVHTYESGGYIADLPARALHAEELISQLQTDGFLSAAETRCLVVDFALYNAQINSFCVVRLTFEFLETGGVLPSSSFRVARLLPYEGEYGPMQEMADALMIAYMTCLLAACLRHMWYHAGHNPIAWIRYVLNDGWKLHDWAIICIFWAILSIRYRVRSIMQSFGQLAPFEPNTHYPQLIEAADIFDYDTTLLSIETLLVYALIFREIEQIPYIRRTARAMARARQDMAGFLLVTLIFILAFAMAFHLAFGKDRREFRTVSHSMITLVRFIMGDIDVGPLLLLNRDLAMVLIGLFVFVVYLNILNMAVAILQGCFQQTPSDDALAEEFLHRLKERLSWKNFRRFQELSSKAREALHNVQISDFAGRRGTSERAGSPNRVEAKGAYEIVNGQLREVKNAAAAAGAAVAVGAAGSYSSASGTGTEGASAKNLATGGAQFSNPLVEAVEAYNKIAEMAEPKAVSETRMLTHSLKLLYLRLSDEHATLANDVDTVRSAIETLRDENFALAHAMRAKGIHFDPDDPLRELSPEHARFSPSPTGGENGGETGGPGQDAPAGGMTMAGAAANRHGHHHREEAPSRRRKSKHSTTVVAVEKKT